MTCSINIVRKAKPECECKYINVDDVELERARRAIIQHIAEQELLAEICEEELKQEIQDINVERCLLDLYEKVGILKQRIEKLEGR